MVVTKTSLFARETWNKVFGIDDVSVYDVVCEEIGQKNSSGNVVMSDDSDEGCFSVWNENYP